MQTLGLSDSTPRTESRLKSLFWPTIHNEGDVDYLTQQGFWICLLVALFTLVTNCFAGSVLSGIFEFIFFFLGGIGIRERSRFAAFSVFAAYLLSTLVLQRYTGQGFGVIRMIFLALLLANIRGMLISARWPKTDSLDARALRLNETLGDKLSDTLPSFLWPKTRLILYLFAAIEIVLLLIASFAPLPKAPPGA
jgi:hypothetical protein